MNMKRLMNNPLFLTAVLIGAYAIAGSVEYWSIAG